MFIKANRIQYHVKLVGEGEPLLLLHGFTGNLNTWTPFIEQWSRAYRLIMIDLIGHGKTDHPEEYDCYRIENVVADLKVILNQLGIGETHILGYSMGGRVALSFSILHPEIVSSLILESSSPGLKTEEERLNRRNSDNILAERIERDGVEAFVDYWEKIPLFTTQEKRLTVVQKQKIRKQRLENQSIGLANSLRGMGTGVQPSWWEQLSTLKMPVLLLAGELDQKFCLINDEMHKKMTHSHFLIIHDAGHAIHVEQPGFFGKIVKDYLDEQEKISK